MQTQAVFVTLHPFGATLSLGDNFILFHELIRCMSKAFLVGQLADELFSLKGEIPVFSKVFGLSKLSHFVNER